VGEGAAVARDASGGAGGGRAGVRGGTDSGVSAGDTGGLARDAMSMSALGSQ
jgi:hypothetical protein